MRRRLQLFLCFSAAFSISQSQTLSRSHLEFERIGIADGLPTEYVNCIAQDRFGFLWFGTKNGLCRYDGHQFKTYKSIPGDSTSLAGDEILYLFSDSRGRLWVDANGLHQFNFDHDNFTRIVPPAYDAIANKLKYVSTIVEDNFGNLWLGTFGQGLFKFDPGSGQLAQVELGGQDPKPFNTNIIFSLSIHGSDTIWVAGNNRQLTVVNTRTDRQANYSLTHRGNIQRLFADRAGRLWLGAMGEPLKQMHLGAGGEITFSRFENIKTANYFSCLGGDRDGNLWIGTQQEGLYVFNPRRNEIQHYRHRSREIYSLPGDDIQDLYEDRAGNMWVATDKGVGKWARWKKPFRHFQHDTENPNSINRAEVTGINRDVNGDLWISTLNTGFCKFNPRTEIFAPYDPATCGIKSPWALEILAGRNGLVWIATNFQHGLNRFEVATGKFKEYLHNPKDTTSLSSNLVTTLFEDREGRVWIGPAYKGLNLYDPRLDGFRHFKHDAADPTTLSDDNILTIYQDAALTLWIGTSHGLNRFDPESGTFVRYFPSEIAGAEAKAFEVYSLCEDARHNFWLGSNFGLYRFDQRGGTLEHIVELSGLSDGRIFGILDDGAGNLWLQTTTAIVKFDPQVRKLRIYDRDDGWIQNAIYVQEWMHAYAQLNSGELVFGGANGITIFHPDSIKDNPDVPPVHITGFRLFYEPVEVNQNPAGQRAKGDSLLQRALLLTDDLKLRHNENTFSFEFAALDYTLPKANQYAFMLEGFHDDWIYSGNEHTATFTNIPPGDYTFRVKGANNDGLWNETGASIKITILPPWWQTTTAYMGYAALLLAIFYGVRRFEMNRIHMRNELKMKNFEAQKLQEVDRLKSRFFANISHEFRTPLTLILGSLEDLMAKVKDMTDREELRVMQRNANRLLRLINQLLDLSRLESRRMTLHVSRGDFIAFLKGIAMSFASLAEQKKITLRFETEAALTNGSPLEIYFDRDKIEKIFYNLLSNAFKFTPEGGEIFVKVEVGKWKSGRSGDMERGRDDLNAPIHPLTRSPSHPLFRPPGDFVQITIKDTGIGIPAGELPRIFDHFYQVDSASTREYAAPLDRGGSTRPTSFDQVYPTGQGSGLGLALTKELVERHYGEIEAHSQEGMGSEFVVRLPIGKEYFKPEEIVEEVTSDQLPVVSDHANEKGQVASERDTSIPIIQQSRTPSLQQSGPPAIQSPSSDEPPIILVVDDHPDVRNYIRKHLEPDFHVIEAKDGREGVDTAHEAVPDLVISDVMMPKLDGYQLCEALKTNEKTSHIPVILLTAKAGEENKLAGLETGADDYLIKPFSSKELQARAKNLIALRRKLAEHFRREGLLHPREIEVPSVEEAFLQKLMQVTEQHLSDEDFEIDVLRRELNMGQKQLYRKIKALTGQTPTEFIRTIRLRRAKQLLAQNAGTVSEIAFQVGFNNLSYFSKCFREEFGQLPSELAKV